MRTLLLFSILALPCLLFGQKMLLLERANSARVLRMYPGETLVFRLNGKENYWYKRTITDIIPSANTLLLDNYIVKLDSISEIKVRRKGWVRLTAGTLITFGSTLAFATTIAALYRDEGISYKELYLTSALSFGAGMALAPPRKLKLGNRHRLRIVEIKFGPPDAPSGGVGNKSNGQ